MHSVPFLYEAAVPKTVRPQWQAMLREIIVHSLDHFSRHGKRGFNMFHNQTITDSNNAHITQPCKIEGDIKKYILKWSFPICILARFYHLSNSRVAYINRRWVSLGNSLQEQPLAAWVIRKREEIGDLRRAQHPEGKLQGLHLQNRRPDLRKLLPWKYQTQFGVDIGRMLSGCSARLDSDFDNNLFTRLVHSVESRSRVGESRREKGGERLAQLIKLHLHASKSRLEDQLKTDTRTNIIKK